MSEGTPALVAQLDLIEWFKGPLARGWGDWILRGTPGMETLRSQRSTDAMGLILSESMNKAETVFVSRDMCTIIEAAAETLPDVPIQPEQVFWPTAFIYFERPIIHAVPLTPADSAMVVETRAIYYDQAPIMDAVAANEVAEGLGMESYLDLSLEQMEDFAHKGLTHVTFVDVAEAAKALGVDSEVLSTQYFPFDQSGWIYGKSWETVDKKQGTSDVTTEIEVGLSQQRKLLLATLLIAQQYIAVRSSKKPTRQVRRRAERMGALPEFGEIIYITLRRNSASVEKDGETSEEWSGYSHRFPVKGYWKHQFYSSKQEHHLIWVEPYIKGPPDKPLIIKDKVYRLVR